MVYGVCIWVLLRRKRQAYIWHTVSSTISFALASIQIILLVILLAELIEFCHNQNIDANMSEPFNLALLETLTPTITKGQTAFGTAIFLSL